MTLRRALSLALLAATLATAMHFVRPRALVIESAAEEPKPPAKDEFPFSPRPNRCREIHWQKWSPEVFEAAQKAGKPVAVSLTATWCQKCHDQDEGAFSDERVIRLLNDSFVCVRVDTDRMPEVRDRYLSGKGWPTTAFCAPSGDPITRAWFMTADEFVATATSVKTRWETDREGVLRQIAEFVPPKSGTPVGAEAGEAEEILKGIEATWAQDGTAWTAGDYRFPTPQNIELYVRKAEDSRESRWLDRAAAAADMTLRIEDPVEFGFYRVAMKPDWSEPHYEKLLETNAGMLSALVQLWRATGEERFGKAASRTVEYMNTTLAQKGGGWSASQDADKDYFKLDKAGRARVPAPRVDAAFYSGVNAQAASAMFAYAAASGDAASGAAAVAALERVFRECWSAEGFAHGADGGRDLLHDLVFAGEASLDAHQATGAWDWVQRAKDVAARIETLADADGGLRDCPLNPSGPGNLRMPFRKSSDNGRAAGFLVRLHHVTGEENWKGEAEKALKSTGAEAKQYLAYSAEYALGVMKLRRYPLHLVIVGPKAELPPMIAAADRFWHAWKTVTVLESNGKDVKYADLDYPASLAAYPCVADACGPPVKTAAEFEVAVKAFLERNK